MTDWPLLLLAIAVCLAVAWYSGFLPSRLARWRQDLDAARRPRSNEYLEQVPRQPAGWDGERAAERLVDRQAELETLLESLGFSSRLERRLAGSLMQLRATTKVEIPDVDAFSAALERVEKELDSPPEIEAEALRRERLAKGQDPLLRAVLETRGDLDRILELLSADPIDSLLPFVEEIPFHRDGEVIWRTPIDLAVVRKTPGDPSRFAALLGEIQEAVEGAPIQRPARATDELLDAIARARRGARRPDVYLPTLIRGLEAEIATWLDEVPEDHRRKRKRAMTWLAEILEIRARYGLQGAAERPLLRGDALIDFKRTMQESAQVFLREPWMHGPWSRSFMLSSLIASELAGLAPSAAADSQYRALSRIHEEVASGLFDAPETVARLHRLEERGLAVHSLVYALLRPSRTSGSTARQPSTPAAAGPQWAAAGAWRSRAGGAR